MHKKLTRKYDKLLRDLMSELISEDIQKDEHIYIIRGNIRNFTDRAGQEILYAPITKYYIYLNEIGVGERYFRMKSGDVIDEMSDILF